MDWPFDINDSLLPSLVLSTLWRGLGSLHCVNVQQDQEGGRHRRLGPSFALCSACTRGALFWRLKLNMKDSFSKRHGFASSEAAEIRVREDAPDGMRGF